MKGIEPTEAEVLLQKIAEHRRMTLQKSFLRYLLTTFRRGTFYRNWQAWLSVVRGFRLIRLFLRISAILFGLLEAGTLVLLSTVLFLILLPLLAFLFLAVLLTAFSLSGATNRMLRRATEGKKVILLFLPEKPDAFFKANAMDLARGGFSVFLISPYRILPKGLSSGRFYVTARKEYPDVYLIRPYYFFSLKRHVLRARETVFCF